MLETLSILIYQSVTTIRCRQSAGNEAEMLLGASTTECGASFKKMVIQSEHHSDMVRLAEQEMTSPVIKR